MQQNDNPTVESSFLKKKPERPVDSGGGLRGWIDRRYQLTTLFEFLRHKVLCPGWERRYEGAPAFHALGTIGRMEDVEPLEDGRFQLRLVGLGRVRLSEIASEAPYRLVRVVPLPEA